MELSEKLKLYLVLETEYLCLPLSDFLENVIKGGVTIVQLRNKSQNLDEKIKYAYIVREITAKYNTLFLMNDSIDMAVKVYADGVHIGINDGNAALIRQNFKDMIIGYSCNNMEDVEIANKYADYADIGPFTETYTKKDHRQILGAEGIYKINNTLKIPAVAIGGINIERAAEALKSGVNGLAVSSFLCKSKTPYDDAKRLLDIINERV